MLLNAKSFINKLCLHKKFFSLKMDDGDPIVEHLNSLNTTMNYLILVGMNMNEEEHCIILLCSFPYSWDNLVIAIGRTMKDIIVGWHCGLFTLRRGEEKIL